MQDMNSFPAESLIGQLLSGRFRPQKLTQSTLNVATFEGVDQQRQLPVRIHVITAPNLDPLKVRGIKNVAATMRQIGAIPNVIGMVSGGIHDGHPFLIAPMLPGATLRQKFELCPRENRATVVGRTMQHWLPSAAAALDAAHKLGVCHGRLTPDSIVILPDGSAAIDGLQLSQLFKTLDVQPTSASETDSEIAYQDPETKLGKPATAAADQFALAQMISEAIGQNLDSLKRATLPSRDVRYRDCSSFAAEVLAETAAGPVSDDLDEDHVESPLELEALPPDELHTAHLPRRSTAALGYELEIDDRAAHEAATRGTDQEVLEEDLKDLTFTSVKGGLLTEKSAYSKAVDLQSTRASWRKIAKEYASLSITKKRIASVIAATLALALAIWLLQVAWTGVIYVTSTVHAYATRATSNIPSANEMKMRGEQLAEQMRGLWDEHVTIITDVQSPDGTIVAAPPPPEGEPWSSEEDHVLAPEDIAEPTALIEEIVGFKGALDLSRGIGVFNVDNPSSPDLPTWIGGFKLSQGRGQRRTSLLHGTLYHHAEDGTDFVARHVDGVISDFWIVRDGGQQVVHAKFALANGTPVLHGAAVVVDEGNSICLAVDYAEGQLLGGQWCKKEVTEEGVEMYSPPETILPIETLPDGNDLVDALLALINESVTAIFSIEAEANTELQRYTRANRIR